MFGKWNSFYMYTEINLLSRATEKYKQNLFLTELCDFEIPDWNNFWQIIDRLARASLILTKKKKLIKTLFCSFLVNRKSLKSQVTWQF